ncbi:unnamed protein product [Adineta ricciae]|uniref:G-protein coupled receptors family 1 profile domain-containing protein n=1 Tax=Adineta ricciae TaxID=249248 RepID=A0A814KZT2_ADIRI|nr:unnamed protein product [Adineta ricciae]
MRHATSWRKNQSGDDAFGKPLETSSTTTTVYAVLPFIHFSPTSTNTIHIKFQNILHHRGEITQIIILIILISQKYNNSYQNIYSNAFIYIRVYLYYLLSNMQQLSNDTGSWNLIVAPIPSSLLYNSNAYDTISHSSATLDNIQTKISSLITPQADTVEANSVNYWAFALILFPLFTIFGNVLVVISVYREKSLHTITNYFVVSLAISDITVAAVVMPFAIYLEYNRVWELSDRLCDFWVASDCMACTASILNLVAIAVDRYIAVTKPLKYARHKNPKRVSIMIVIVWVISFVIALPIVGGANKSDVADYPRVSDQCAFFNNKFLIFSSLGSFFIPCIIIFAIYYRIFAVIMAQAKKNRKQWRPKAVIESAAAQHRTNADHLVTTFYHDRQSIGNPPSLPPEKTSLTLPIDINEVSPAKTYALETRRNSLMLKLSTPVLARTTDVEGTPTKVGVSSSDPNDDEERDDVTLFILHQQTNGDNKTDVNTRIELVTANASTSMRKNCSSQTDSNQHRHSSSSSKRAKTRLKIKTIADGSAVTAAVKSSTNNTKVAKRKAYSRMKKERKATQTLIIVLSKLTI